MDASVLVDTQLSSGSGPGLRKSGRCCCSGLRHNTHRALNVNSDGGVRSPGQWKIFISPLSSGQAVRFPTRRGFRRRDPLPVVLTMIHRRGRLHTKTTTCSFTSSTSQDTFAVVTVTDVSQILRAWSNSFQGASLLFKWRLCGTKTVEALSSFSSSGTALPLNEKLSFAIYM